MRIPWTTPEKRWRDALLDTMIPSVPGIDVPGIAHLDLDAFGRRVVGAA